MKRAAALVLAACVGSCAPVAGTDERPERSPAAPGADGASVAASDVPPIREEPWTFDGRRGRAIYTPHFVIRTTLADPSLTGRLGIFAEAALEHARALAGGGTDPPGAASTAQEVRLNTYVFRGREEWERFTRERLGEQAGPFLRIRHGGYAWGATAALFDSGRAAPEPEGGRTLWSVMGHEGWHQYAQRAFKEPLPPWLDEALATLCEGHRWDARGVRFTPEENAERREELVATVRAGALKGVERLVLESVGDLAGGAREGAGAGGDEAALSYYGQVWALGLMLRERCPVSLERVCRDAAEGQLAARLVAVLGPERAEALSRQGVSGRSLAVLEAYFLPVSGGLAALETTYREKVLTLVGDGHRGSRPSSK